MYTPILAGIKRGWKEAYTNVFYVVVQVAWIALIALIFFHVWYHVVDDPRRVLVYVAVAEAFYFTASTRVARVMEQEYTEGRLDIRLLRPVPLWLQYFSEMFGPGFFQFLLTTVFLSAVLYAYLGVYINVPLAALAYPLFSLFNTLFYFILGTLVVELGRLSIVRWIASKIDVIFILVPREVLGNVVYYVLPSAYMYYWPTMLVLEGTISPVWFLGLLFLFPCALLAERRMQRKIEVFGG